MRAVPTYEFIGQRRIFFIASIVLLVISLAGLFTRGLNLGLDFRGGLEMDLRFTHQVDTSSVRAVLARQGLSDSVVQYTSGLNKNSVSQRDVLLQTAPISEPSRNALLAAIQKKMGSFTVVSQDKITGTMSAELVRSGVLAVILASVLIVLYMIIRFDLRFALTGIVAVFYDAIVSIGIVALWHFTVNSPFVAAVLTIIGYSINDRIIIFDRIRENMRLRRKESLAEIVNTSLNQTLGRSINTAVIVVLAMLAIYLFGGETTRDFAATTIVGVIFGAYSSIFLASPLWYLWMARGEKVATERRGRPKVSAK